MKQNFYIYIYAIVLFLASFEGWFYGDQTVSVRTLLISGIFSTVILSALAYCILREYNKTTSKQDKRYQILEFIGLILAVMVLTFLIPEMFRKTIDPADRYGMLVVAVGVLIISLGVGGTIYSISSGQK